MLLNTAHHQATPSNTGVADTSTEPVLPAPATPAGGRALLQRLEQQAQAELAALATAQAFAPAAPPIDAALMVLAWDLGLSGEDIETSNGRKNA